MPRARALIAASALTLAACSSAAVNGGAPSAPAAPPPSIGASTTAPSAQVSASTSTSTPTTALAPTNNNAPYEVATHETTYVDATRPTPANGSYPGAPTRTLRVRFYVPKSAAGAPYPLILFTHGVTGVPEAYVALLSDLARAGYVVAAPAYPLSKTDAPGGPTVADLGNQPGDASFVIDRVLADARGSGWLHGLVDPNRIGAAGHSLGGFTTYELVYNLGCADKRIKAAVVLSGGLGGCPGDHFTGIDTPLLAIHGDHDRTVPYKYGKSAFDKANRPKYMMTILGGAHSSEELGGTSPKQRALTEAMIAFFDEYLRGQSGALRELRGDPNLTTFDAQP